MWRAEDGDEGNEGKTTTALGAHEWLKRAVRGEIETPRFERSVGEVRANELAANCGRAGAEVSAPAKAGRDGESETTHSRAQVDDGAGVWARPLERLLADVLGERAREVEEALLLLGRETRAICRRQQD